MNEGFISITNGNVHFRKWGTGKKLLIALHGYGADGSMYRFLSKQLAQHFTFYAVDLPFHGKTSWESNIFQPTDFQELVTSILEKEKATHCSMLGHSFGARLALKLAEEMPKYFDHLYLLSPDGIRTYGLGLANRLPPRWRKYMFKQLKRPERWLRLAEKLRHLGIISQHAESFLHRNLANSKTRKRLLAFWLSLADFRLDRRKMQALPMPVLILIGNQDPLVDVRAVERFSAEMPHAAFQKLDGKHWLSARLVAPAIIAHAEVSREFP